MKDARAILGAAVLGILVAVFLVKLFPVSCKKEGFQGTLSDAIGLTTCPRGTQTYKDETGSINCCAGEVNGNRCEGRIFCTFSSDRSTQVPLCRGRNRKYRGEIWPIVVQYFSNNMQPKFQNLLNIFAQVNDAIRVQPAERVSQTEKDAVQRLFDEEVRWYRSNNTEQDPVVWQEEVMYIITTMQDIFRNNKNVYDQSYIQQVASKAVCGK